MNEKSSGEEEKEEEKEEKVGIRIRRNFGELKKIQVKMCVIQCRLHNLCNSKTGYFFTAHRKQNCNSNGKYI